MDKCPVELVKTLPKIPQREDDSLSQLSDLYHVANHLGMYDAADVVGALVQISRRKETDDEQI